MSGNLANKQTLRLVQLCMIVIFGVFLALGTNALTAYAEESTSSEKIPAIVDDEDADGLKENYLLATGNLVAAADEDSWENIGEKSVLEGEESAANNKESVADNAGN